MAPLMEEYLIGEDGEEQQQTPKTMIETTIKTVQQNVKMNQEQQHSAASPTIMEEETTTKTLHRQQDAKMNHWDLQWCKTFCGKFQEWLFSEGCHCESVEAFLTQYCLHVREQFGIPLDRLFYASVQVYPQMHANVYKWEDQTDFMISEMPPDVFERRWEVFGPDEPFAILEQGQADSIRIRDTDEYISADTNKWFRGGNYTDYLALPDIHQGIWKGGFAWSTKTPGGFLPKFIEFFEMTHSTFTSILRLHTNNKTVNKIWNDQYQLAMQKLQGEGEVPPQHQTVLMHNNITALTKTISKDHHQRTPTTTNRKISNNQAVSVDACTTSNSTSPTNATSNNYQITSNSIPPPPLSTPPHPILIKTKATDETSDHSQTTNSTKTSSQNNNRHHRALSVSFRIQDDENDGVREILHLQDYSPSEKDATWYDRNALQAMREATKKEARLFESGQHNCCPRGLEAYTSEGSRRNELHIQQAYASVFEEIALQQKWDDETIADAYFLFSEPCATEAHAMGRRDELAVRTMTARWRRIQKCLEDSSEEFSESVNDDDEPCPLSPGRAKSRWGN